MLRVQRSVRRHNVLHDGRGDLGAVVASTWAEDLGSARRWHKASADSAVGATKSKRRVRRLLRSLKLEIFNLAEARLERRLLLHLQLLLE